MKRPLPKPWDASEFAIRHNQDPQLAALLFGHDRRMVPASSYVPGRDVVSPTASVVKEMARVLQLSAAGLSHDFPRRVAVFDYLANLSVEEQADARSSPPLTCRPGQQTRPAQMRPQKRRTSRRRI